MQTYDVLPLTGVIFGPFVLNASNTVLLKGILTFKQFINIGF